MIASARNAGFRVVGPDDESWDEYVRRHPQGSIFHTSKMIAAFAATSGFEPYGRAAIDAEGNIVALLVSCHVKTLRQFSAVSSRAVQFAEPLCDPDPIGIAALTELVARHDDYMRSRALFCEVRAICEPGFEEHALAVNGYQHRDFVNYVIKLQDDVDLLWKKLHKRLRQKLRSTRRKGVVVRDDTSPEGLQRLYPMLQASYGRARVPLCGEDLFRNAVAHLPPENVRVRTAFKDREALASIISLVFGDRVFSWYGGTLRRRGISPFALIVWDDIAWAAEHGFSHYDFGGAGSPDEEYGPRKFKARFGGTEVHYGRYVLTYSRLRLRLAEVGFQISRQLGAWS